jgi:protein dithiol:quinone oxidoreductase
MPLPSTRLTFLILSLGCAGLIGTALLMQEFMTLKPCALCITQRVFVIAVGVSALLAFLINPKPLGRRLFAVTGLILSIIGGGFSTRHVWLEHLPKDQVPACGPGLNYLLENFPLKEALAVLLRGDGNCAEVAWSLLGVSLAGWTLVAFVGLAGVHIWQIVRRT